MTTEQIFYSVGASILASFIFLFLVLLLFKPKIRISPFICKGKFSTEDPTEYYFIKIVNVSLFSAYDVKFELLQADKYSVLNDQMNARLTNLELVSNSISHIKGYRPSWLRRNAPYALRIRTAENLSSILTNDYKSVIIKISLRHGLTGLVKVHSKEYTDLRQVRMDKFGYGLKFESTN